MSTGIQALHAALAKAKEDGTLGLLAPHLHQFVIDAFCDAVAQQAGITKVTLFRELAEGDLFKFAASRDGFFKDFCTYRKTTARCYVVVGGTGSVHTVGSILARVVPQKEAT